MSTKICHNIIVIPGILILKNNKIFGKNKRGKPYYRIKPNDKTNEDCIATYQTKQGFHKHQVNKYILYSYKTSDNETIETLNGHPIVNIIEILGNVDSPQSTYLYLCYCRDIIHNTYVKKMKEKVYTKQKDPNAFLCVMNKIENTYDLNITDRTSEYVFSIDPKGSKDFDDACGITTTPNGGYIIHLYIANVPLWFDIMNLWDVFSSHENMESKSVSTIYLPHCNIPMLPRKLSEDLCSLKENQIRYTFILDIHLDNEYNITSMFFDTGKIKVNKNYVYDSPELLRNKHYIQLYNVCQKMNQKKKETNHTNNVHIHSISNSHEMVEYLMILMNHLSAKYCYNNQCGIFRHSKNTTMQSKIPIPIHEIKTKNVNPPTILLPFINQWLDEGCQYNIYNKHSPFYHKYLNLDMYIHITSPIRRFVDIINMTEIMLLQGFSFLNIEKIETFLKLWRTRYCMDYINQQTKTIQSVQRECILLDKIYTDNNILNNTYDGYCISITNDIFKGVWCKKYVIFIKALKILKSIYQGDEQYDENHLKSITLYEKRLYKFYLFKDADHSRDKIRIELIK